MGFLAERGAFSKISLEGKKIFPKREVNDPAALLWGHSLVKYEEVMSMIIDCHAHIGVRGKNDWDLYKDYVKHLQRGLYWFPREIRRVKDDSIVENGQKTLWDENLWGDWKGMYNVNLSIEGERYVWKKDGVKYHCSSTTEAPQPPSQLVSLMDKTGVDKAVLQNPRDLNRYFSQIIRKYPNRFIGLCQIEESEAYTKEALKKLKMYVKDWKLKGLYYDPMPGWDGDNFYTKKYEPLWREVISLGIPVCLVCYNFNFETFIVGCYKLLKNFPEIILQIVHGFPPKKIMRDKNTVRIPKIAVELVKNHDVYLELLVGINSLVDYGPHDEVIRCLYDTFGPSKLIWGSEFTHNSGPRYTAIQYAKQLGYIEERCNYMSKDDLRLILGGNIQRIYGI